MDIKINNLKKMYGNKVVFENLNLQFNTGVYGILGPNGAGKSSFIKILTTNILEYDGEILVDNIDIKQMTKVYRSMIGYMPQQQAVYDEFTLEQYLYYIGRLKGISRWRISKEIDEIVEKVNLSKVIDKKIRTYSGGMKQRAVFAQSILGNPKLLVLDEPSAGLDPGERVNLRNIIAKNSKNRITIISTHIVSDIEYIADYIILINKGKIVKVGTPDALKTSIKKRVGVMYLSEEEFDKIKIQYSTRIISKNNEVIKVNIIGDKLPNHCLIADIDDINLEDVYIYYIEEMHTRRRN
ncbi:ABC transporter ATP-binding protein [Butyribacter sp.]|jgi:ABC-2 type transport system ATP-binding protein|uniref:ABC transporter ATP-binding protein n=1 Tax=Butyribacter sp. TaxID=2822465 RepID=UPI00033699BB|nr:ATP-binding cassette domain-containing protein [Butyribacter sp.]CDB89715.1 aBC-2 type transport system ATP-binding protein [Clostridium sp. CAG:253]